MRAFLPCHTVSSASFAIKCLIINGTSISTEQIWSTHMEHFHNGVVEFSCWRVSCGDLVSQQVKRKSGLHKSQYTVTTAEGRQVFPQVSYVHSPERKFSGGHRFSMSERVEQKTWKMLEEIQRSLILEWDYCLELALTGIFFFFFCTKISSK